MPILPRSARQSWAASSFKIREIYSMGSERNHFAIVCWFLLFRSDDLSFGLVRSFYQDRQQVSFAFQNSGKESNKILVINLTDNSSTKQDESAWCGTSWHLVGVFGYCALIFVFGGAPYTAFRRRLILKRIPLRTPGAVAA